MVALSHSSLFRSTVWCVNLEAYRQRVCLSEGAATSTLARLTIVDRNFQNEFKESAVNNIAYSVISRAAFPARYSPQAISFCVSPVL